jgi:hypothetical protein
MMNLTSTLVTYSNNTNKERSYLSCYRSFASMIIYSNLFSPNEYFINLTDPDIKQYYSNICNYLHEKYGIWIDAIQDDPDKFQYGWDEFKPKYYSNGVPESVKQLTEQKDTNRNQSR